MAPRRRNARVPRAPRAPRAPTPPASPQREEVVQEATTPNTIDVAQVGNLLQTFMTDFLATLTQAAPQPARATPVVQETVPAQPEPPRNTRVTRARAAQQTPPTSNTAQDPPEVTPVIRVSDTNQVEVDYGTTQNSFYLAYRRDFNALNIKFFEGVDGPNDADTWLDLVSDELINLRVPLHFRVSIAAGRLSGRARRWWRDTQALHGDDDITWAEFRTLFLDEYVSGAHREEKCKELDRLRQGSMTVQEYREKFEELSVYKESFRTHPKDKMNKFIDGLKWS